MGRHTGIELPTHRRIVPRFEPFTPHRLLDTARAAAHTLAVLDDMGHVVQRKIYQDAPANRVRRRPPLCREAGRCLFPTGGDGVRAYRCSGSGAARPPSWRAHGA